MKKKSARSAKASEGGRKTKKTATKTAKKAKTSNPTTAEIKENAPSLESILCEADKAFTGIVIKYMALGESLVKAITFYGAKGRKAFRARFPLTDNALRNLELVGRGRLLPQFAMCSDRFVKGLVDMVDSLTWQHKLIGASKNGMIRVRINGDVIDARFEDLRSEKLVDGVLSVISSDDKDLTPEQICEKLMDLRKEVRSKFERTKRPFYAIGTKDGTKVVRFFKSRPIDAEGIRAILKKLEE